MWIGKNLAGLRLVSFEKDQPMLTEEEKREIEAEFPLYEQKQAACIEALKIVQKHRGWVSDEAIHDLAQFLNMAPDELDSVATFYNLIFRRPVGKHVMLMCDSVTCWMMGYDRLRERVTHRLGIKPGETTADGQFTLLPIVCLGTCDHAPALMMDDELYQDLDTQMVDAILDHYQWEKR
jgi:NADH-quinone oxidoreductase subunit E